MTTPAGPGVGWQPWTPGAAGTGASGQPNIPVWDNVTPPVPLNSSELASLMVMTQPGGYPVFTDSADPDPLMIQGVYDANITAMDPAIFDALVQASMGNTAPIAALTAAAQLPGAPTASIVPAPSTGVSTMATYVIDGMAYSAPAGSSDAESLQNGVVPTDLVGTGTPFAVSPNPVLATQNNTADSANLDIVPAPPPSQVPSSPPAAGIPLATDLPYLSVDIVPGRPIGPTAATSPSIGANTAAPQNITQAVAPPVGAVLTGGGPWWSTLTDSTQTLFVFVGAIVVLLALLAL